MNIRLLILTTALVVSATPLSAMNESKILTQPLELCPELEEYVPQICWLIRADQSLQELLPAELHQHILQDLLYLHILSVFLGNLEILNKRDSHELLYSIRKFEQICDPDALIEILKICLAKPELSLGKVYLDRGQPTIFHTACEYNFPNEAKIIISAGGDKIPGL